MKDQTRAAVAIINNGSASAHSPRPNSAPYTATKHAISGLTKSTPGRTQVRHRLRPDRIGNARTPWREARQGVLQPNGAVVPEPMIDAEHVANTVVHMASLPLDTNILSVSVMATKMPFVGRADRALRLLLAALPCPVMRCPVAAERVAAEHRHPPADT